jgi:hypothetical protein
MPIGGEGENMEATKKDETRSQGSPANKGLAAWLMEIARETSTMTNDGRTSKELMDEL